MTGTRSAFDNLGETSGRIDRPRPVGGSARPRRGCIMERSTSLFQGLFDLSFHRYATPAMARMIYLIWLVAAGLLLLASIGGTLIGAASAGLMGLLGLAGILLNLLLLVLITLLIRAGLESAVALCRIAESVTHEGSQLVARTAEPSRRPIEPRPPARPRSTAEATASGSAADRTPPRERIQPDSSEPPPAREEAIEPPPPPISDFWGAQRKAWRGT